MVEANNGDTSNDGDASNNGNSGSSETRDDGEDGDDGEDSITECEFDPEDEDPVWDTCVNDRGYWSGVRSYWRTVTMTSNRCDLMDAPHRHDLETGDPGSVGHYLYLGPLK